MHQVLHTLDILFVLFGFVAEAQLSALVRLALTCRLWHNLALDILWRDAPLSAFGALLGIRMWAVPTEDLTSPSKTQWDRFNFYASRLGSLSLEASNAIGATKFQASLTTNALIKPPLFPGLTTLDYGLDNCAILPWLVTPGLNRLVFRHPPTLRLASEQAMAWHGLQWRLPLLHHLDLSGLDLEDTSPSLDILHNVLAQCPAIVSLKLGTNFAPTTLMVALGSLPRLRFLKLDLKLKYIAIHHYPLTPTLDVGEFETLEALHHVGPLESMVQILSTNKTRPQLLKLDLEEQWTPGLPRDYTGVLWKALCTSFQHLTELRYSGPDNQFWILDQHCAMEHISLHALRPLLSCRSMKIFDYSRPHVPNLTTQELAELLIAWPSLTTLRIFPFHSRCDQNPRMGLEMLDTFAEYGPQAQIISIPLDGSVRLRPEANFRGKLTSLRTLDVRFNTATWDLMEPVKFISMSVMQVFVNVARQRHTRGNPRGDLAHESDV